MTRTRGPATLLSAALLAGATLLLLIAAPDAAQADDAPLDATEAPLDLADALDAPDPWGLSPLRLAPEFTDADASADAIAQTRRRTTRRTYRRRYYRSRRTSRSYYHNHIAVVPDPDPPRRVVTSREPRPWRGASLTVRTVGLSFDDNTLARGSLDGEDIAGFGVGLRLNLDRHWATEFAVDMAGGRGDFYDVAMMPVTASLIARLFPQSKLDLYGIAGGGVYFTEYDYHAPVPNDAYILGGGHVGGGAELKLGHFLLTGDVRYLVVQNAPTAVNVQRSAASAGQALTEDGDVAPARLVRDDTEDDWRRALQAMVGLGYRW